MAETLGTAVLELTVDDSRMTRGMATSETHARSTFGNIVRIAAGAAIGIAGAFAARAVGRELFVAPIQSAGQFQQTLNVLQTTAGASNADLSRLSSTAMKLGSDIHLPTTSASDAADAMLELARGGMNANQVIAASRPVLLLATAAQIDNASAARMVTDTLGAFGLKATDTKMVVDSFAGAANASTASMTDVALALAQSGQGFKTLGIPVGDASTAIAQLANNGIKGSDAGTSLKTMLQRLNPTTKQAKEEFQKLGIDVFNSNGKFIGMRAAIAQISPKLQDMTQKQRSSALSIMFGSDATRAANILLGMNVKQYDALHARVTKAGQAQALANAATKGFNGALSALRSGLETVQLKIGLALLPVLTRLVTWLGERLPGAAATLGGWLQSIADWFGIFAEHTATSGDALDGLTTSVTNTQTRFDQFMGVLQGVWDVISTLFNFVRDNINTIGALAAGVAIGVIAWQAYQAALRLAALYQTALNIVTDNFPAIRFVLLVAAVVAAIILLYQHCQAFRDIVNTIFGFITNTVLPAAQRAWQQWAPVVQAALTAVVGFVRTGIATVQTIIQGIVTFIQAHWQQAWAVIGPMVRAQFVIVETYIRAAITIITNIIDMFSNILHGRWGAAWGNLKTIVSTAINAVVTIVHAALTGLAGTAGALALLIGHAIERGIKAAAGFLAGLAGDLMRMITGGINQAATQAYNQALHIGGQIARGVVKGVQDMAGWAAKSIGGAVGGWVSSAYNVIGSTGFEHAYKVVGQPTASGVVAGFVTTMRGATASFATPVRDAIKNMQGAAEKEMPHLVAVFGRAAEDAKKAFDARITAVTASVNASFKNAEAQIEKWKAKLTPAELQIQANEARAHAQELTATLDAAWVRIHALPAEQAAAWAQLLGQQATNIASLQRTLQGNTDDALLAGNTFNKNMAASANNGLATNLIAAQAAFNNTKTQFDNGLVTQEAFIASANALDDAKLAASEDNNASTLLDQYNTWQAALAQQAESGQAITDQATADEAAKQEMQAGFNQENIDATAAKDTALQAMLDDNLKSLAATERADRDREAAELNAALVAKHNRVLTHLQNVEHAYDLSYDRLVTMARNGGTNIGDSLAAAMRASIPKITSAAGAVAAAISQYLAVHSPTEKGPMSDLDHWWDNFADTLVGGLDRKLITDTIGSAVSPTMNAGIRSGVNPRGAGTPGAGVGSQVNNFTFNETPADADPVAIGHVTAHMLKRVAR